MRFFAPLLVGVVLLSAPEVALAVSNPNNIPTGLNFRQRADVHIRYRLNSRAVDQATVNDFSENGRIFNTNQQRARTTREAQLERMYSDVQERNFSGESRSTERSRNRRLQLQQRQAARIERSIRRRQSPNIANPASGFFRTNRNTNGERPHQARPTHYYRATANQQYRSTACANVSSRRRQACEEQQEN